MERLPYLATFVSLILGLGVANVLANLSALIKRGRQADWYWIHTLWGVFLLLAMASEWWILLQWERVAEIGFFIYLFLLVKPSILFVASDLLFPDGRGGGRVSLEEHFFAVRRPLFLVLAAYPIADLVDTLLKGWDHFRDLGPIYPILVLGGATIAMTGAFNRSERVHGALVLGTYAVLLTAILNSLAAVS